MRNIHIYGRMIDRAEPVSEMQGLAPPPIPYLEGRRAYTLKVFLCISDTCLFYFVFDNGVAVLKTCISI